MGRHGARGIQSDNRHRALSEYPFGQVRVFFHNRLSRITALARTMSFRMMAVMATFGGFPALISWVYLALRSVLKWHSTMAGIRMLRVGARVRLG